MKATIKLLGCRLLNTFIPCREGHKQQLEFLIPDKFSGEANVYFRNGKIVEACQAKIGLDLKGGIIDNLKRSKVNKRENVA